MPTETPVPKDHPLMIAWEKHKTTGEYASSLAWALREQHHVVGLMWNMFAAGWKARELLERFEQNH